MYKIILIIIYNKFIRYLKVMMNKIEEKLLKNIDIKNQNDIPVAAAIIQEKTIFVSQNTQYKNKKINDHAEIIVINNMIAFLNTFNLSKCKLYITMEPCLMCVGAILNSKIREVYYYVENQKTGFLSNNPNFFSKNLKIKKINNDFSIQIKKLLKNYFSSIRK